MATENGLRGGHGKGPPDVPPSGRGIEIRLGSGDSATHQHLGGHWNAPRSLEAPGQEQSLVVTTLALAAPVERHREQEIRRRAGQRGEAELRHQVAQRISHSAAAAELEGVYGLPHQAAVAGRRASVSKARALPPAGPAEPFDADGDATATAPGRPDALQALPARGAQRVTPAQAEHRATDGTERREDEIERRGDPGPPARGDDLGGGHRREVIEQRHDGYRAAAPGVLSGGRYPAAVRSSSSIARWHSMQ